MFSILKKKSRPHFNMTYREKIQQDIAETYIKLQRSREEEAQAKQKLDRLLEEARKQELLQAG